MKFTKKRKSKYTQAVKRKQARIDRTAGEKFNLTRALKSSGNRSTTIVERSLRVGTLSHNNALAALYFKLSDLPSYTDFSLYDQYRIIGVKVTFINTCPNNLAWWNGSTAIVNAPATLITAVDQDDATVPANLETILQHESCIIHGNGRKTTREFVPSIAASAYQGTFTGYSSRQNQWVDILSPDVQHYGLKFGSSIPGSITTASSWNYEVYATYIVELRMPV